MRYAGLLCNDVVNGEGVCVSYWAQGCGRHCRECHNPQTWDFNGGIEDSTPNIILTILRALRANGVKRNFSILGGEPLCLENIQTTTQIVLAIRHQCPSVKIFVWTGYTYEELEARAETDSYLNYLLRAIDVLIDGPYLKSHRDITLKWRGSTNQRIIDMRRTIENKQIVLYDK